MKEMKDLKSERDLNKSPKKNAGFYISLAVCIAAIAAAGWTTYRSVSEYTDVTEEVPVKQSSQKDGKKDVKVDTDVSGEKYENSTVISQPENSDETSNEISEYSENEKAVFNGNIAEYSETAAANTEVSAEISLSKISAPIENGEVIKPFSPKNPIESKTLGDWRTHSGVDISAGEGSPVRAIMAGKVLSIYNDPMLGNVIEIDHSNGYVAYYCGLTDTTIAKEGENIKSGDTIGYIGKIPSESKDGSHLHLEVKLNDDYIDPTIIYNS